MTDCGRPSPDAVTRYTCVGGFKNLPLSCRGRRAQIIRLTGQPDVPLLVLSDGQTMQGSAEIVRWAEQTPPTARAWTKRPLRVRTPSWEDQCMDSGSSWSAVGIDEVESIDWRRTGIDWRPVRRALGVEIVGMGAFTAREVGQVVIEPHIEVADGRGHQEVYIVVRGRARFTIDGQQITAVPGTVIRVDPQAHREAVALDSDTAVLALGGDSVFEPSASEWIERARPHIHSAPARAQEILRDMGAHRPSDRAIDVGEALLAVGRGETARAREIVKRLVGDGPEIRSALETDPDLAELLPDVPDLS